MKFLITHINYAGMNAREVIYKSLSSKSAEPLDNGPSCHMNKSALDWIWLPQMPQSGHKTVSRHSNFVSVSPNLHPWWDFYLETRGRYLKRIWTDPAITTTSLGATTINLLKFPCLHTGQHNRHESFTVLPRFFCPLPTHFEVYSALSGLTVTGVSHRRCEAKPIPIIFPWL